MERILWMEEMVEGQKNKDSLRVTHSPSPYPQCWLLLPSYSPSFTEGFYLVQICFFFITDLAIIFNAFNIYVDDVSNTEFFPSYPSLLSTSTSKLTHTFWVFSLPENVPLRNHNLSFWPLLLFLPNYLLKKTEETSLGNLYDLSVANRLTPQIYLFRMSTIIQRNIMEKERSVRS